MQGTVGPSGRLSARLIRTPRAPLLWRLRNTLRRSYLAGWLANQAAFVFSRLTGIKTVRSELRAVLRRRDGSRADYGVLSYRLVTDAGVAFVVDDMDNSATDITTLNFHGVGLGTGAEAAADAALGTESTTILNPDSTRATGTKTQPSANILRSVGTVTFDGSGAITEHGIFSQAATGGGTLWDRSVFAAINVASGDSIIFTYNLTFSSGG